MIGDLRPMLQTVQGCSEPRCHPEVVDVSDCMPIAKYNLYSLVATTTVLLIPGISVEHSRVVFAETFQAAETVIHDVVAQGFKVIAVQSSSYSYHRSLTQYTLLPYRNLSLVADSCGGHILNHQFKSSSFQIWKLKLKRSTKLIVGCRLYECYSQTVEK